MKRHLKYNKKPGVSRSFLAHTFCNLSASCELITLPVKGSCGYNSSDEKLAFSGETYGLNNCDMNSVAKGLDREDISAHHE
jgi:hypothetical protein